MSYISIKDIERTGIEKIISKRICSMADHQKNQGDRVALVMVPFPAQGHLNQLLQLSCLLISSSGLPVYYVSTATHNRQAKQRAHGLSPRDMAKINFRDFPIPPFESPPADSNSSCKFPSHLQPAWEASLHLREPFFAFLSEISSKARRIVVIHDPLMAYVVQDTASMSNAESYVFSCSSAINNFFWTWESKGKPSQVLKAAPKWLPSNEGCFTSSVMEFMARSSDHLQHTAGHVYNSCRLIEGTYFDLLAREEITGNRKHWAVGPILPLKSYASKESNRRHKCLEWLDKQAPNSVIYVSFGSTVSLGDTQIKELAIGLERSKQKFIWVLRDADIGDIFAGEERRAQLPQGFEERVEGMGMVLREWAPQPEILGHPSTGGFMSHCGWNSCIESISMGVPIAAWPMHSDQPINAALVTAVLQIGIDVREWAHYEDLVTSSAIEGAVKRLMASEEGAEIRKRAEELGGAVRQATEEGGISRAELESFVQLITR